MLTLCDLLLSCPTVYIDFCYHFVLLCVLIFCDFVLIVTILPQCVLALQKKKKNPVQLCLLNILWLVTVTIFTHCVYWHVLPSSPAVRVNILWLVTILSHSVLLLLNMCTLVSVRYCLRTCLPSCPTVCFLSMSLVTAVFPRPHAVQIDFMCSNYIWRRKKGS